MIPLGKQREILAIAQERCSRGKVERLNHKGTLSRDKAVRKLLVGLLGEYAAGQYLDLDPDYRIFSGGDQGHDFVFNGHTIQVKTRGKHWDLLLLDMPNGHRADLQLKSDFIIGATLRLGHDMIAGPVFLHGFLPAHMVDSVAQVKDMGYGSRLAIPFADLIPLRLIRQYWLWTNPARLPNLEAFLSVMRKWPGLYR